MNKYSLGKLIAFILAPFIIIYIYWWIIEINFEHLVPQFFNSMFSSLIISLGVASICSWWFCLSRSAAVKNPMILTAILILITFFSSLILSLEFFKPKGLYTPLAIHLNNSLQSLTILLSFAFVLIIGILISRDLNLEEE